MNILNKVTIKGLKKNKVRTLVTIIGIVLSAAMFTAVTSIIASLQNLMVESVAAQDGGWYGKIENIDAQLLSDITSDERVTLSAAVKHIGFSQSIMEERRESSLPYLYIAALSDTDQKLFPVTLIEGRMPQNSSEIILPKHLRTAAGIQTELGEAVTLDIGKRMYSDEERFQGDSAVYTYVENGEDYLAETFVKLADATYTVVGYFEKCPIEGGQAPAYMAFTFDDGAGEGLYDAYFIIDDKDDIRDFVEEYKTKANSNIVTTGINTSLLRYMGVSMEDNFNSVLYSLAAILIFIIMFGSIALIYNAFSISVGERTKQFAILKSVGATKRQIMHSVFFEGFVLSVIAIPIGILAGLLGIGITLRFLSGALSQIVSGSTTVGLTLCVSAPAIIIAAAVCLITVFISAYIPAKRAVRLEPVAAIRQTTDIKLSAKKVKANRLIQLIFKFEGMLADKNFKRNKKRYRATVISLFVSIVLFISASSLCAYLTSSVTTVYDRTGADLQYRLPEIKDLTTAQLAELFAGTQGVDEAIYAAVSHETLLVEESLLTEEYKRNDSYSILVKDGDSAAESDGKVSIYTQLWYIEDEAYKQLLELNNLDVAKYTDAQNPVGLLADNLRQYNTKENRYYTYSIFDSDAFDASMTTDALLDPLHIEGKCSSGLFFMTQSGSDFLYIYYPYSVREIVAPGAQQPEHIYVKAENYKFAYDNLITTLEDNFLSTARLYNIAETIEANRAVILVINVFSYGFIILISLISAANVFNTISTNINLRRREFAMLRSVGMTGKGLKKMMNYECLLYGLKSLILGLPVSFLITYAIYLSFRFGIELNFFIPWQSVVIAVGSVFAVVFSTMIYSMRRIAKHNTIDELRNENL